MAIHHTQRWTGEQGPCFYPIGDKPSLGSHRDEIRESGRDCGHVCLDGELSKSSSYTIQEARRQRKTFIIICLIMNGTWKGSAQFHLYAEYVVLDLISLKQHECTESQDITICG